MKKRVVALAMALVMAMTLAACGGGTKTADTAAPAPSAASGASEAPSAAPAPAAAGDAAAAPAGTGDNPWAGFDTSTAVNINFTALGVKGPDFDRVIGLVNERMKGLINTTVTVTIIPLSDFATKYPLVLAGGEDVDLIFTAPWLFYAEQVGNGAFMELDFDFIGKWMPVTMQTQIPQSWDQAMFGGKLYSIPRNESDFEQAYGVTVRKDMMDKYGITEIKSVEDLEKYLDACLAEVPNGMFPMYSFPSFPIDSFLFTQLNNWQTVDTDVLMWDADSKNPFSAEDCFYRYDTPEFLEYALRQARWAQKGYWPANAITGVIHINDLFREGKSACDLNMYKAANMHIDEMRKKGVECEYYDILPEGVYTRISPYNYDGVAITSFSKNPERAALALDVMKNDVAINNLLMGGVEGEHYYLDKENNTHTVGPKSADYAWSDWAWALRSQTMPTEGGLAPSVQAVREDYIARNIPASIFPVDGFSFDNSNVSAEFALVSSIVTEYRYSFDLGVFGDQTEAKYNEFIKQLKEAGIDKVVAEAKSQLADFLAAKQ
ncbi:MAG: ABC transporter substrate-binding protein [Lachnospiraceae bacterium]|jgi:ABC-type glycerol-3-phosphate transport system substrate-binding protein|nr:ABC transporter substrate-binding protein [Lachnospiraceae bacterium]